MKIFSRVLSALVKVLPEADPPYLPECCRLTALKGESVSFQIAYLSDENVSLNVKIDSPFGKKITVRSVENVTAYLPGYPDTIAADRDYISPKPRKYPEYLRALRGGKLRLPKNKYKALWLEAEILQNVKPGDYTVTVTLEDNNGEAVVTNTQKITVYNATLPKASLIHTEWFHTDCIADYYGYEVFGEKHWKAIENFMRTAYKRGINMILTPVFTLSLDTAIGGERTTSQLVDVVKTGEKYVFGFERLRRWITLAQKCGMEYFEISHLFTQWGANAAPKVMATVDGEYKRIFGWDTLVEEGAYPEFLGVFLPALTAELKESGIADKCYFHVSDEPSIAHLSNYMRAKNIIAPHIEGFKQFDALSNPDFYDNGAVSLPVPSSNHIEPFLERDIPERWAYYCCSQGLECSNRFMAMNLARTRALGIQLFKYNIKGFLHWGYNFYNSRNSVEHINPYTYKETAETGFPSGDRCIVYPGRGGKPEESIRLLALYSAQTDLRALIALSEKTSYEHVMELIEGELSEPITFKKYPRSDYYYINLRNKVNAELSQN